MSKLSFLNKFSPTFYTLKYYTHEMYICTHMYVCGLYTYRCHIYISRKVTKQPGPGKRNKIILKFTSVLNLEKGVSSN